MPRYKRSSKRSGGSGRELTEWEEEPWDAKYKKVGKRSIGLWLVLGFVVGSVQVVPFFMSVMFPENLAGFTLDKYEEILVQKDPTTRRFGFGYTDMLVITEVTEGSPAHEAKMSKYKGRRIRRCNGVPIYNSGDFQRVISARDHRTSLTHHITLDFVPRFFVGGAVRAVKRIAFRNGDTIPQGTLGVITRVPGSLPNSPAQVRMNGVRFDAQSSQVEPVVETDNIPRRFDKRPGWILKNRGTEDVEAVITELKLLRHGYLQKLLDYGVDRMDHLAGMGDNDAALLDILPLHLRQMRDMAREVVRERQRRNNHEVAEEIAYKELGYLYEAQTESQKQTIEEANRLAAEKKAEEAGTLTPPPSLDKNAV